MTSSQGSPEAETEINTALVRGLLAEQHPDLARLPLNFAAEGWDNEIYRLGPDLAVRLPRRLSAVELLENERRALTQLASILPLKTPVPVRAGLPGCGYPWQWSIVSWVPGRTAEKEPPAPNQAETLAGFLRVLHAAPTDNARFNPFRCVPLAARTEVTQARLQRLQDHSAIVDADLWHAWHRAVAAAVDVAPTWIHADLHGRNVLVDAGRLCGVVDWGDSTRGDPALDLASVWMLLPDREARVLALRAYGDVSTATLERALGWAIFIGAVLFDAGVNGNPADAALGATILSRVRAGPGPSSD